LSGRRDVLVVASVSCLYGIGNPIEFQKNVIAIEKDQVISRTKLLHQLVQSLYSRTTGDFNRGNFRVNGDVVDIFPGYADIAFKLHFFGDEIEEIEAFDPIENRILEKYDRLTLFKSAIINGVNIQVW
jgi:excinuclease ABC subunit B